jgi:hypothetical protein
VVHGVPVSALALVAHHLGVVMPRKRGIQYSVTAQTDRWIARFRGQ